MYEVHVGRQPILDGALETHGYELLFRQSESARAADFGDAGDQATSTVVVNTFLHFGLEQLTGDKLAFINITRPFATGMLPLPLEPSSVVLELVNSVKVDDDIEAGVQRLVDEGFRLALDGFTWDQGREGLLDVASYVKIDVRDRDRAWLAESVRRVKSHGVLLVAERVETLEDMDACLAAGFDLFQGYFLLQPKVLTTKGVAPGAAGRLTLLSRLSDPDVSVKDIESLVAADAALNYRLLRAANSAASGVTRRIDSVRTAVVMLGLERLRSWLFLMTVAEHADSHDAQLAAAATRARMCELLAPKWPGVAPQSAFLTGLLSRLDLLLGMSMEAVVESLPLEESLQDALLTRSGPMGELLTAVECYERYDGRPIDGPFSLDQLASAYLSAVSWSSVLFQPPSRSTAA
jgi:EAL and modified HD-GYP domain-containing signal transduction protein